MKTPTKKMFSLTKPTTTHDEAVVRVRANLAKIDEALAEVQADLNQMSPDERARFKKEHPEAVAHLAFARSVRANRNEVAQSRS